MTRVGRQVPQRVRIFRALSRETCAFVISMFTGICCPDDVQHGMRHFFSLPRFATDALHHMNAIRNGRSDPDTVITRRQMRRSKSARKRRARANKKNVRAHAKRRLSEDAPPKYAESRSGTRGDKPCTTPRFLHPALPVHNKVRARWVMNSTSVNSFIGNIDIMQRYIPPFVMIAAMPQNYPAPAPFRRARPVECATTTSFLSRREHEQNKPTVEEHAAQHHDRGGAGSKHVTVVQALFARTDGRVLHVPNRVHHRQQSARGGAQLTGGASGERRVCRRSPSSAVRACKDIFRTSKMMRREASAVYGRRNRCRSRVLRAFFSPSHTQHVANIREMSMRKITALDQPRRDGGVAMAQQNKIHSNDAYERRATLPTRFAMPRENIFASTRSRHVADMKDPTHEARPYAASNRSRRGGAV